jgi:hypothetical protein
MFESKWRPTDLRSLMATILLLCSLASPPAQATNYVLEDPSVLTAGQEWYLIAFDTTGTCTRNEGWGYGGGWYYYPLTNTYRQWFYRGPYAANQDACMTVSAAIVSLDPNRMSTAQINVIWTTPAWSARGTGAPPLAADVSTTTTEAQYVGSDLFQSVPSAYFETVEPVRNYTIGGYSPEWVGIEVHGKNVKILRWVAPICQSSEVPTGACCNATTGDCFISEQSQCTSPYAWKGANTTCASCGSSAGATMDFGDAPDTYCTLRSSDGARHTVVSGVYMGRLIDAESDGQPNASATGDDSTGVDDEDGVVLTGTMSPGELVTVDVTASVRGYLNAWVDFDHDGTFSAAGDQIFKDTVLTAGVNHLTFTVPAGAIVGDTFARFRFSTRGLLSWKGAADDGEVEDYKTAIVGAFQAQANSNRGASKWYQAPQVNATSTPHVFKSWGEPSDTYLSQIVADDWQCQDSRPVVGFQWWGTFAGWQQSRLPSQLPSAFHIAIWTNTAAGGKNTFSHPNTIVWETTTTSWVWTLVGQAADPRKVNSNETSFEFTCLLPQDRWFYQNPGTSTTTYWISIAAVYDSGAATTNAWTWMTTAYSSGNGAVKITAATASNGTAAWPPHLGGAWSAGSQLKDNQSALQNMAFCILTNEGASASDTSLSPVYRFWSDTIKTHFYTISEGEKQKLINQYADVWVYEGIAFYAYPSGSQPVATKPVYRFLSALNGDHFYTASESDKAKLVADPKTWTYEGIVWYAYD